jgi:C4-dicarboxylate-specific signal transduction histidine kinase
LDLCRLLRDREGFDLVPVVMVSREKEEARMRAAVEAGVDEVIFCPFTVTELWIRVRNMVRSRLYLRQVEEKNAILNNALADLKESEAMLQQAEKLTQLGEMSAGIVHEINNPLNYSHTAMFILRRMLEDLEGEQREEFEDVVGDIRDGLDRVNQIVKDLRAFATRSGDVSSELNLAGVVQTAVRLLGHKLSNISFECEVAEEILIRGNENQLCQVILNLIKNGVEATEMAKRGLENSCISVRAEETEEKVHLRIRDNGTGIDEKAKAQVFAPFFSTKGKGKGMGLGLSICVRIMEEHGGIISVDSEEGAFTEFTLTFPAVKERGIVAA